MKIGRAFFLKYILIFLLQHNTLDRKPFYAARIQIHNQFIGKHEYYQSDSERPKIETKINKEIRNYTESMFFGLSLRQFIFSVLACGVAVGLYFILRPHFGTETLSWVCILGAAPFALMGFVKYNGMNAEQ